MKTLEGTEKPILNIKQERNLYCSKDWEGAWIGQLVNLSTLIIFILLIHVHNWEKKSHLNSDLTFGQINSKYL